MPANGVGAASQIAGLTAIPIVIKSVYDDRDILLLSLVENLQRDDLNPIEEAVAYEKMAKRFALTHEQIANGIGKSRSYITNSIRMLDLPETVLDAVKNRKITTGHAKVLLQIPDAKLQSHYAVKTQAENLTVRDLERLTVDALNPRTCGTRHPSPTFFRLRSSIPARVQKAPNARDSSVG